VPSALDNGQRSPRKLLRAVITRLQAASESSPGAGRCVRSRGESSGSTTEGRDGTRWPWPSAIPRQRGASGSQSSERKGAERSTGPLNRRRGSRDKVSPQRTLPRPRLSFTGLAVQTQASAMDTVDGACKGSANCTSFRVTRSGGRRSVRVEPGSTKGAKLAAGLASSPARGLGTRADLLSRRGFERTCEVSCRLGARGVELHRAARARRDEHRLSQAHLLAVADRWARLDTHLPRHEPRMWAWGPRGRPDLHGRGGLLPVADIHGGCVVRRSHRCGRRLVRSPDLLDPDRPR
jgi:hypothetical protein